MTTAYNNWTALHTGQGRAKRKARGDKARAEHGELPEHLQSYWQGRIDDPRMYPNYCARQARKTPAIPWHNGEPCLACGKKKRNNDPKV